MAQYSVTTAWFVSDLVEVFSGCNSYLFCVEQNQTCYFYHTKYNFWAYFIFFIIVILPDLFVVVFCDSNQVQGFVVSIKAPVKVLEW